MRVEYVALSKLLEWPGNPKEHDLEGLGESLERFGFVEPILFDERTKRIVAGHGRREKLLAWRESGKPAPDRIVVRGKEWFVPVLRGLAFRNEHEAEAYLLGSNQLVIKGGYNATALAEMLARHVDDASGLGWKQGEISDLVARAAKAAQSAVEEAMSEEPEEVASSQTVHQCPKCGASVVCS
jgi:hypothetical protein